MDHNAFLKMFLMPVRIHKARVELEKKKKKKKNGIGTSPAKRLFVAVFEEIDDGGSKEDGGSGGGEKWADSKAF